MGCLIDCEDDTPSDNPDDRDPDFDDPDFSDDDSDDHPDFNDPDDREPDFNDPDFSDDPLSSLLTRLTITTRRISLMRSMKMKKTTMSSNSM